MKKTILIHEGLTYEYLVPGLFIFLVGAAILFFSIFLGILIVISGLILMILSTGIEVDVVNQRIRKYQSFLFLRFGVWHGLKYIIQVELKYNPNSANIRGPVQPTFAFPVLMPNPGGTAKTFDLYLIDDLGNENMINPFLKISLALKTLKALEGISHLKIVNRFEEMMKTQRRDRR